jgi:hypothetical protein
MKEITKTENVNKFQSLSSFGDARRFILQTMLDVRNGDIGTNQAMAIAANMKVLNDNIQTEINYAKIAMQAKEKGHDFGKIVRMGTKLIGESED